MILTGSTVSGNSAVGDGGGIQTYFGDVTLTNSVASGNMASGKGGGMSAIGAVIYYPMGAPKGGRVTLTDSTATENSAGFGGGGISANSVTTLTRSTVSGNSVNSVGGGGILTASIAIPPMGGFIPGNVILIDSTVSGNKTTGANAWGGGVLVNGSATLTRSTVSGNSTSGSSSEGGGITATFGNVTITDSTISGNSTAGSLSHGGGVYSLGAVTVTRSTIANNHADHATATGGGIWNDNDAKNIKGSILAANTAGGGSADLRPGTGTLTVAYSVIGDNGGTSLAEAPLGMPDVNGNFIGGMIHGIVDPKLGPLAGNGGLTMTHALLVGSPALDAGDPAAMAGESGVPDYDQRGMPFTRVLGGRIDIGAVESQPIPPAIFGDFNGNGVVDAADYVVWRKTLGTMGVPAYSGADGDGTIDQDDYDVWRAHFGMTVPAGAGGGSRVERHESRAGGVAAVEAAGSVEANLRPEGDAERGGTAIMARANGLLRTRSQRDAGAVERNSRQDAGAILRRDDALLAWAAIGNSDTDMREDREWGHFGRDELAKCSGESFCEAVDAAFERVPVEF